jgi:potassium large conductance calcium-activated channel subfamily M alpha protein 1
MKNRDLQRAGVKKAKAVIILSKLTSNSESSSNMVDMDTIFIYKAIKNEIKAMMIIAELISVSALSFLNSEKNDESTIKDQGYWLSPSFAIGEIFIGSMLDTLICQAFYNPFITNIIKQLIMGSAGSNFSTNFQNKLNEKKITQSTLYLLPIKDELLRLGCRDINKNMFYREIFDLFIKNSMVPIGLYRNNQRLYLEEKNQPYVYLCPGKDDLVDVDKDKVYILSNERFLNVSRVRREKTSRVNSYIQINTASRLIDKSNELTLNLVQKIKKVVNNGNQKLRNNFAINKVTNDVKESMRNELNNMYDDLVGNKIENIEEDKK